ncbi:MAG: hypothetical protein HXY28_03385, partial [Hydrogenophilaceae bacterium]|nr:hypothetical protein [Hydrogenophilaceae bacterium]
MHVPIRPAYTSAAIARKLARCRAKALEWAALILEGFGLAALARDVRAACADELRAIALHLRALIVLKALADAPLEAPRKRIAHPHAAPPGCRWRAGYGSS